MWDPRDPIRRLFTVRELEYLLVTFWITAQIGEAQAQVWVEFPAILVSLCIALMLTWISWTLSLAELLHEISLVFWVLGNGITGVGLLYDIRTGGNIAPESDETDEFTWMRHWGMGFLFVAVALGLWSFALGVIEIRQSNRKTIREMWKENSLLSFWFGRRPELTPLTQGKQVDGDSSSKGQLHYKTDETMEGAQEEEEYLVTGYGNTLKKGEFHVMSDLPAFKPPLPCLFANWREYDNIHSLYWAMLDLAWNIDGSIFGIKYGAFWLWTVIIFMTLWISVDFIYRSSAGYYRENVYYWSVFLWLFWNGVWQLGELVPSDVLGDHTYYWPMGSHPNSFWNFRWWTSWGLLTALVPITVTELHHVVFLHDWRDRSQKKGSVVLLEPEESK